MVNDTYRSVNILPAPLRKLPPQVGKGMYCRYAENVEKQSPIGVKPYTCPMRAEGLYIKLAADRPPPSRTPHPASRTPVNCLAIHGPCAIRSYKFTEAGFPNIPGNRTSGLTGNGRNNFLPIHMRNCTLGLMVSHAL